MTKQEAQHYFDLVTGRFDLTVADLKKSGTPVENWIYGHFHESWTAFIDGIRFKMLDIMKFYEIHRADMSSEEYIRKLKGGPVDEAFCLEEETSAEHIKKLQEAIDKYWNENNMDEEDICEILNTHMRTPY